LGEKRLEELENRQAENNTSAAAIARILGPNFGWSMAFVGIALLTAIGLLIVQLRWQKELQPLAPAARATREMYRFVRFTGLPERANATPDERAQALAAQMPDVEEQIGQVNAWYVRERYGAYPLSESENADAQRMGIGVQKRMWRTAYAHHIGRRITAARVWLKTLPQTIREDIEKRKAEDSTQ
jgi:hypothetical protein